VFHRCPEFLTDGTQRGRDLCDRVSFVLEQDADFLTFLSGVDIWCCLVVGELFDDHTPVDIGRRVECPRALLRRESGLFLADRRLKRLTELGCEVADLRRHAAATKPALDLVCGHSCACCDPRCEQVCPNGRERCGWVHHRQLICHHHISIDWLVSVVAHSSHRRRVGTFRRGALGLWSGIPR
jgi:hypothetical protein